MTAPRSALPRHAAALALLGTLAGVAMPARAGLVDVFWGPAWLDASATSTYRFTPSGLMAEVVDTAPRTWLSASVWPGFPAGGLFATGATSHLRTADLPEGSGSAKDTADGTVTLQYTVGTGGADDAFAIGFHGTVSNENSWLTPFKQADLATVHLTGVIGLEISQNSGDRTGFWFGDRVGSIRLDPLRTAAPYEAFGLQVVQVRGSSTTVLASQAPGDAGRSVDVYFGERYELRFDYTMQVPLGIDPDFDLSLSGSVSAVPEPAPAALLVAGLLGLAWRRRTAR